MARWNCSPLDRRRAGFGGGASVPVSVVAVNHYGYVAGLLAAPPERAIKVATGFLMLGGAVVVYAGQLWLDTAPAYWSCTALTTAMIGAHVIVL